MSSSTELSPELRESIGEYVSKNLRAWFDESVFGGYVRRDIELRERMVRVEEELKNERDLMRTGFERMDSRFSELREASDKRFTEQREDFVSRFDRIDERFTEQREDANRRFAEQSDMFNTRFDEIHRHNNRWMTVVSVAIGLTGIAITISSLMA